MHAKSHKKHLKLLLLIIPCLPGFYFASALSTSGPPMLNMEPCQGATGNRDMSLWRGSSANIEL